MSQRGTVTGLQGGCQHPEAQDPHIGLDRKPQRLGMAVGGMIFSYYVLVYSDTITQWMD